jgi:putative ABC transport system ATP-binding protein
VTIITAEKLTKIYREGRTEVRAVSEVSLAAGTGEVVAIMGPSGSGKTTLLSMLGGILRPTTGTVTIDGAPVWALDERQLPLLRRRYVGFVFQGFNLFAALTALDNVEVALNLKGLGRREARRQAARLLETVGLEHRANFLPRDLSGGEKQRVSIARALAGDPPLLLADEPTANLDWRNGEHVMKLLHSVSRAGHRAVIVVTHDPRVQPYIDRAFHLDDGRLVA